MPLCDLVRVAHATATCPKHGKDAHRRGPAPGMHFGWPPPNLYEEGEREVLISNEEGILVNHTAEFEVVGAVAGRENTHVLSMDEVKEQ